MIKLPERVRVLRKIAGISRTATINPTLEGLFHTILAGRKGFITGLEKLQDIGFEPTSPPPEGLNDASQNSVLATFDNMFVDWFRGAVQEAEEWMESQPPGFARRAEAQNSINLLHAASSLERLTSALLHSERSILELGEMGNAASSGIAMGLALIDVVEKDELRTLQAELVRQRSGLSRGNLAKTARRMKWQQRVAEWCRAPGRDWNAPNSALATAFRGEQPKSGAPTSSELDKYIKTLRP